MTTVAGRGRDARDRRRVAAARTARAARDGDDARRRLRAGAAAPAGGARGRGGRRRAEGARARRRLRLRPRAVRQEDRHLPGRLAPARRHLRRDRAGALARLLGRLVRGRGGRADAGRGRVREVVLRRDRRRRLRALDPGARRDRLHLGARPAPLLQARAVDRRVRRPRREAARARRRRTPRRQGGLVARPESGSAGADADERRPGRAGRDPRALEGALEGRGQPLDRRAARDALRGLRLHGLPGRRLLARPRGRRALLHRAPDRVPRHRLRAAEHRHRAAGRRRGGDRHRHAHGEVARQRADRRDDDLAERDLLPLGSRSRAASRASASTPTCRGGPHDATRSARSTSSATGPASARSAGRSESRPSASTASSTRRLPRASATTTTRRTSSTSSTAARRRCTSRARSGSSARAGSSTSSRRRRGGSRASATRSS